MNQEELRNLMMAALDGEIDPDQQRRLDEALAADPAAQAEYDALRRVEEVQEQMTLIEPTEQAWRKFESGLAGRVLYRPLNACGMVATLAGILLLAGYAVYILLTRALSESEIPIAVRIGLAAVVVGLLAMLISVVIRRLVTLPHDKYHQEVEK